MDPLAELQRMIKAIRTLPDPIVYIVLDHNCDPALYRVDRDAYGQRYILASPAWLDEAEHIRVSGINVMGDPFGAIAYEVATPLYRREELPDEWPGPIKGKQ